MSGFSGQEREDGAKRLTIANLAALLLIACVPVIEATQAGAAMSKGAHGRTPAEAAPAPTGSAPDTAMPDQGFLNLPGYDIEYAAQPNEELRVGDRIKLKVVGFPASSGPGPAITLPPGVESLSDQGWELLVSDKGADFLAVPLKPGKLTIPSLAIRDQMGPDGKMVGRTNPFLVEVKSAISADDPKPEEPVAFKPPVSISFPWWVAVAVGLLVLMVLAAAAYGIHRWRKMRHLLAEAAKPAEPPRPEDEVALARLAELEALGLMRKGQYKAHYFGVSETLKRYLGDRYQFDALESTSREIIIFLEEKKLVSDQLIDRVEIIFEKMDRVKFTDHVPTPEDGAAVLEEARKLILQTRKPSVTPILQEASDAV